MDFQPDNTPPPRNFFGAPRSGSHRQATNSVSAGAAAASIAAHANPVAAGLFFLGYRASPATACCNLSQVAGKASVNEPALGGRRTPPTP